MGMGEFEMDNGNEYKNPRWINESEIDGNSSKEEVISHWNAKSMNLLKGIAEDSNYINHHVSQGNCNVDWREVRSLKDMSEKMKNMRKIICGDKSLQ